MSPNGQEKNAGSQHLGMRGLLSLIFQSGTNTATQTYSAFISYNRSVDGRLAPALQSAIQKFAKPWFQLRGIRVFRDDSNLSANPDLWESVKRAIQQAEFFILLASPESGRSKWVAREVEYWLSRKSIEKLLLAVTESSEAGSQRPIEWPDVRALLPQTLAERYSTVPRFVDLRWAHHKDRLTLRDARFRECVADLAAPLHNRSKDELFGEDVRQHRRTVRLARATIALLGVLLIISTIAALVAAAQRQEALHQLDIATSRQLAAEADLKAATDPQLASLLSLAAFKIQTTAEAQTSIVHQLDRIRQIQGFLQPKTPGPINNIATSPDGKIVAASSDTSTTLWAVQSRVQLGVIESIGSLSFSPDSKVIAIGSQSAVGLWRTDNLLAMGSLPTGTAGPVLFGNDGNDVRTISIGTGNTTIATWGLSDGTQKSSVSVGESSGGSLDPTGSIALLDRITTVDLVNTRDGRQLASLPTPDMPFSYAFSADGHLLAVGGQLGTITIWNVTDRTIVRTLSGTKTAVNSVAFSDDNRTLAAGSADKQVVTWDLSTGVRRDTLSAHTGIVTGVAFLTGEGTLVSGGEDGKLVIWGPSADASRIPQRVLNGVPNLAAATPDGQFLVTSNESNTTLFDARTGLPVFTFSGSADDVAISPDGRLLATRGQNSKIILIWDLNDRQLLISLPSEGGIERSPLAFSPDGQLLAASEGNSVSFWSTAGFSRIGVVDVGDDSVVSMAFSPDSRTLATGNFFTVTLIDPTSKRPAVTVPSQSERDRVYSISFSPDGHTLAWVASGGHNMSASIDGKVVLWDVERGVVTAILPGQTGLVNSVAFSPDSQILASGDGNGVTLWSVPQRSRMTTLGEKAAIVTLAFVSNGSTLVAGERNGSIVRFWNVDPKTWTDAICGVVGREMTAEEWATYLPGREQIALCG